MATWRDFGRRFACRTKDEQHPSLRSHELQGGLQGIWSASASDVLGMTFERSAAARNVILTCSRHCDRGGDTYNRGRMVRARGTGSRVVNSGAAAAVSIESLDLLRELAHRLRTPLATVHGYASLLESQFGDEDGEVPFDPVRALQWVQTIQGEIERATELLADLSRMRSVLMSGPRPTRVELRDLLEQAVEQVRVEHERPVTWEGAPLTYRGDPLLLQRLLYHVVGLGAHRGERVDVSLSGTDAEPRLDVRWAPAGGRINLQDPWIVFCEVVARAHAGTVVLGAGDACVRLGAVEGAVP